MIQPEQDTGEVPVARVPRGFLCPVNPAGPIELSVETLAGEKFGLLIGGVAPLGGRDNLKAVRLTMSHARIIYRLLGVGRFESPVINLRSCDLLPGRTRFGGGRSYELLRRHVTDLASTCIHIVRPGRPTETLPLVTFRTELTYRSTVAPMDVMEISKERNVVLRKLKEAVFATEFWRACLNFKGCWHVRIDAIDSMTSDLAAYCYLALAPKTFSPNVRAGEWMLRNAAELLTEAGIAVPACRYEFKRLFERARGGSWSVLQQLDKQPLLDGVFRVSPKLEPDARGGFNLLYRRDRLVHEESWEEKKRSMGALYDVWVRVTKQPQGFMEAARADWATLEAHNIEAMQQIGYDWEPHQKFLERVRSFIGPVRFDTVLGSVKMKLLDVEAGVGEAPRDLGRYIGASMMAEFESWAKKFAESQRR